MASPIRFANTYTRLPPHFHARTLPTPVAAPTLIQINRQLAEDLGIDPTYLASPEGIQILAGNRIAEGSEPLAQAYAGHQFGHFVPQLGDGRANLLGEVISQNGQRYDLQLKGSGPTPFSRAGDGRAALGPVLREYLLSESMHALGVPTTRALAAIATGQPVSRETLQPGAILTRVAASHLRVGTFQYFAARADTEALRTLTQYAIARHYPEAKTTQAFLAAVVQRQATLIAKWMCLGFIHGVMNTDNTAISGETIDYGPCAFMEAYSPDQVFSSIDRQGRYAYSNQPHAAHWNLTRLAETLLPLLTEEHGSEDAAIAAAREALAPFAPTYDEARLTGFRRKLGLLTTRPEDELLIEDLLRLMHTTQSDFTQTFRNLHTLPAPWTTRWQARLTHENPEASTAVMHQSNPTYIPRNHLVAEIIEAAVDNQDLAPFQALLSAVTNPYNSHIPNDHYTTPAQPHQQVTQTFCGT